MATTPPHCRRQRRGVWSACARIAEWFPVGIQASGAVVSHQPTAITSALAINRQPQPLREFGNAQTGRSGFWTSTQSINADLTEAFDRRASADLILATSMHEMA